MDLNQKIIAGLLLAFFLITLLRIFRTPLRLDDGHRRQRLPAQLVGHHPCRHALERAFDQVAGAIAGFVGECRHG